MQLLLPASVLLSCLQRIQLANFKSCTIIYAIHPEKRSNKNIHSEMILDVGIERKSNSYINIRKSVIVRTYIPTIYTSENRLSGVDYVQ